MKLQSIGELVPDPEITEWLESAAVSVPFFPNSHLRFVICATPEGSGFPPDVDASVARFLALNDTHRLAISHEICLNYKKIEQYLDKEDELVLKEEAEIWNFVQPSKIVVERRSRRDKGIYVTVDCNCEWEQEHGLQIVFRSGNELVRVSQQDGHLTLADAMNLPDDAKTELSKTYIF